MVSCSFHKSWCKQKTAFLQEFPAASATQVNYLSQTRNVLQHCIMKNSLTKYQLNGMGMAQNDYI